jgi:hypothetical protein
MPATLEKELETYERQKPSLLADEGKFVVICGDNVVGIFTSYEDALKGGYDACGITSFLVRQISAVEKVVFLTRAVVPCLI